MIQVVHVHVNTQVRQRAMNEKCSTSPSCLYMSGFTQKTVRKEVLSQEVAYWLLKSVLFLGGKISWLLHSILSCRAL